MVFITNQEKEALLKVSVSSLMVREPFSIPSSDTLDSAVEFMKEKSISALPIVNKDKKLIGVISQTDIVRYFNDKITSFSRIINSFRNDDFEIPLKEIYPDFLKMKEINHIHVIDVMSKFSYAVTKKTPVIEMLKEMKSKHIHHVYVVDDKGVLIGVISSMDIIKYLTI
ncbi:MAG: CBS domain-containing protein [Cyanobacteriota bacterium]